MIFKPKNFTKETIPKYYSDYFEKLQNFDFEGGMKLLKEIFQDERNQNKQGKPTDFLKEEEEYKSLSVRFQEMIDGFHFSEPVSKKSELDTEIFRRKFQSGKFKSSSI